MDTAFSVVAILFLGCFLVFYVYLLDFIVIGRDTATTGSAVRKLADVIQSRDKQEGIFVDLGSSRGRLIFRVLRFCPGLQAHGIDDSKLRVFLSRSLNKILRNRAVFLKNDILAVDLSEADVVYAYLGQWVMPALEQKLRRELKPGAIAITNTQFLPTWPPHQTIIVHPKKPMYEKMFVYIKE